MPIAGIGSAAASDAVTDLVAALTAATTGYVPKSADKVSVAYNADGTVATVTETVTGAVTTYSYNADGGVAGESRVLSGVTTTRTFSYDGSGNLTGVS